MKGDFSRWRFDERSNAQGVLQQQGRVLLDADWNAQERLSQRWRDEAGRAAFGSGVAAVAADWGDSFKVLEAEVQAVGGVRLLVAPGQVWADGWLTYLRGEAPNPEAPVERIAEFLGDPLQPVPADPGAAGTRDAVILEIHREALNAFQSPHELLEAALGGVDTTERVLAAIRWRLYRMAEGETCDSLDLADDLESRGRLTARLQPTVVVPGDCPVVQGGGYTGFEHNLYRIEIAEVAPAAGGPFFKWSQFNGGLVGRGTFDVAQRKLRITANDQPILRSGLTDFYLEVLAPGPDRPPAPAAVDLERTAELAETWDLIYAARVSLANDGQIDLPAPGDVDELFGSIPTPADQGFFFRLWNGLELVSAFPLGGGQELRDGIQLELDSPAAREYVARDYWTFPVRVGQDDETLLDQAPPEGVVHVRVPLAELDWSGAAGPITAGDGEIEDCRRVFQPLTKLSRCCTYRVGDGVHSHGDFTNIQQAIDALPPEGGRVCVLPGSYEENVLIENRECVTLEGCGKSSVIVSPDPVGGGNVPPVAAPVITIRGSREIRVEGLLVRAHASGIGVLVEESVGRTIGLAVDDASLPDRPRRRAPFAVREIRLAQLTVRAAERSGIEVRGGKRIAIERNHVQMEDVATDWPAITLQAEDVLVRENELRVGPASAETEPPVAADLTAPLRLTISRDQRLGFFRTGTARGDLIAAHAGVGGLWLRGDCERIRVIDNLIEGGIGNGITLGHIELRLAATEFRFFYGVTGWFTVAPDDPCGPCGPGTGSIPPRGDGDPDDTILLAGPPLRDLLIERNRIAHMGLNGISVIGFFETDEQGTVSIDEMTVIGNDIQGCLRRPLQQIPDEMVERMGFGGLVLDDVETLIVRDNRIEDNGPDHIEPVTGAYVQHVEGAEFSRNRILNNGAKTPQSSRSAKQGPRGGIYVEHAVAPTFDVGPKAAATVTTAPLGPTSQWLRSVRGPAAVKVHDNVVSAPTGRALTISALGPVSVVGNQLTSHGVAPGTSTLVASTVQILNLGVAIDLFGFVFLSFAGVRQGKTTSAFSDNLFDSVSQPPVDNANASTSFSVNQASAGTGLLANLLLNGNVLFANNQCVLDLFERGAEFAFSSILIASLDDVAFENNQCDAGLIDDIIISQSLVFGITMRMIGNRFKEGLVNALLSAITFGLLNDTSHNQATHCILPIAPNPANRVVTGNLILANDPAVLAAIQKVFGRWLSCERWLGQLG